MDAHALTHTCIPTSTRMHARLHARTLARTHARTHTNRGYPTRCNLCPSFGQNVKDAAVVALPFAEKEIRKSLNTVLSKLGEVSEAPRQVFSFIERAKMG